MTRISDMSSTQRKAWLIVLADGAVFLWFWQKMTVGLSLNPIGYDIGEFGRIIFGLVVLTVILHVVIAGIFDHLARKGENGRDERDIEIERRGAFWGYRVLQIGVGIITIGILMSASFEIGFQPSVLFETPVQIIFFLIVFSYIADLVKHGVMIYGYGR